MAEESDLDTKISGSTMFGSLHDSLLDLVNKDNEDLKLYRLKEIKGENGRLGDLKVFEHNRRFTVEHKVNKENWRFVVIDNTEESKEDGVLYHVFKQATSSEERFFELSYVQRTIMTMSNKKRAIFVYVPHPDVPDDKKKKDFLKKYKDIFQVLDPKGHKNVHWGMGSKKLRAEIRKRVGEEQYQKLIAQLELVSCDSENKDDENKALDNQVRENEKKGNTPVSLTLQHQAPGQVTANQPPGLMFKELFTKVQCPTTRAPLISGSTTTTALLAQPRLPVSTLFDNTLDPSRFATIDWADSLKKISPSADDIKASQVFIEKFQEWQEWRNAAKGKGKAKANARSLPSNLATFGMKRVADASHDLFIRTIAYQGHEIKVLTKKGEKLIKHLLIWMNFNIHRFNFSPDLLKPETGVYYDDIGVVVNGSPRVHQESIGIILYKKVFEEDIRRLIGFITRLCGGMANLPIMLGHLFGVMKEFDSWIRNFEYMVNHPVFWSASKLDAFCQHMKNTVLAMDTPVYSMLNAKLESLVYRQFDWLAYVCNTIGELSETASFKVVLEFSLTERLGKPTVLPVSREDVAKLDYFKETIGVLIWVRELYSHLSATGKKNPEEVKLFKQRRSQLVFKSVLLLFPVYFCQVSWVLHKLGHRTWFE